MNVRRMNKLATVLEGLNPNPGPSETGLGFNMDYWFYDRGNVGGLNNIQRPQENLCGTTACAAGWACFLWPGDVNRSGYWKYEAGDILGLSSEQSNYLFLGDFIPEIRNQERLLSSVTPAEVATEIRRMVAEYQYGLKQARYAKRNRARRRQGVTA